MIGFIKKDLLTLKQNIKLYAVIFIIYIALAFYGKMSLMIVLPIFSVVMMFNTFVYDDYNKWNSYAATLPNGKRNVVVSKYLTSLILIAILSIIVIITSSIFSFFTNGNIIDMSVFQELIYTAIATMVVNSIMYPLIFKFGMERARTIIFVLVMVFAFIGSAVTSYFSSNYLKFEKIITLFKNYYRIIAISVILILFVSSYLISRKIFAKKEF